MPKLSSLSFYPRYCFSASPTYNTWVKLTAAGVHALTTQPGFEGQTRSSFSRKYKIGSADIRSGQKVYFHLNHPIQWIRLVGVLVAFDEYPNRWVMILDDGSGETIEIVCAKQQNASTPAVADHTAATEQGSSSTRCPSTSTPTLTAPSRIGRTATGYEVDMSRIDLGSVVKVKGGIGEFRGAKQITLERINLIPTTASEALAWAELHAFHTAILSKPWTLSTTDIQRLKEKEEDKDGTAKAKRRKERDRTRRLKAHERIQRERERERERQIEETRRSRPVAEKDKKKKERKKREANSSSTSELTRTTTMTA
ncbi:hypothetical protein MMC20_003693 [Loxospora ochrophaea]|nr:hypothetical protein [Loxospora ochrophaea]